MKSSMRCLVAVFLFFSPFGISASYAFPDQQAYFQGSLCNGRLSYQLVQEVDLSGTNGWAKSEFYEAQAYFPPSVAPQLTTTVEVYSLANFDDGAIHQVSQWSYTYSGSFTAGSFVAGNAYTSVNYDFASHMPAGEWCKVRAYAIIAISDPTGFCQGDVTLVRKLEEGFDC